MTERVFVFQAAYEINRQSEKDAYLVAFPASKITTVTQIPADRRDVACEVNGITVYASFDEVIRLLAGFGQQQDSAKSIEWVGIKPQGQ